jgi:DNA-directed RNA polymerase specialized sigma24 family protein
VALYVSKPELSRMVKQSQRLGRVTDELVEVFGKIALGLYGRYGWSVSLDHDDAIQEAICCMIAKLERFDPDKNLFAYLTTICSNSFKGQYRRNASEWRKIEALKHRSDLPYN